MPHRKTALYLRQSLDRNRDELAVERQRDQCVALCASRGWTPELELIDNDTSATNGKPRPAYDRLLAGVRDGSVGRIVVYHADRLYRQPRDLEDIIDLCTEKNVALATVTGDLDLSNDQGQTVARILGAISKGEMLRKSARQRAAAKQRAEHGRAWWPSRPFGFAYTNDRPVLDADGNPTLNPDEAALISAAYRDVLAGSSLHSIAAAWNAAGITTPKGNVWRGAQVRQLLLNPRNAALREYHNTIVGDAAWPAIVHRDVWEGVCAILADPSRRAGKSRARKHLLTGIARCGKCSQPVGSGMARTRPTYTCKHCHGIVRDAASVDTLVIVRVVERLSRPDAADLLVTVPPAEADELRQRAKALTDKIAAALPLWKAGVLTDMELADTRADLGAKLAAVNAKLTDTHRAEIFAGVIGADDVGQAFDALSLDRQRAIVDALYRVTILPTRRGRNAFDAASVDITPLL